MADPNKKFIPTTMFGMKGLNTFDDPQFIDEHELANCLNIVLDGNQMAPRKGTNLLYAKPVGETGAPQALFNFKDRNDVEYILAKYTNHWYALDSFNLTWILIGSQLAGDGLQTLGATWHDAYYSHDIFIGAVDATNSTYGDFAFFSPSDYSVPDNATDKILTWPSGITTTTAASFIGEMFLRVEDSGSVNIVNGYCPLSLNGDLVYASSKNSYSTSAATANGSTTVSNLARTDIIEVGSQVTGTGIPSNTTVVAILTSTTIKISNAATADSTTSFTATCDLISGSKDVTNVTGATQAVFIGMGVAGADIPAGATVTSITYPSGPTGAGTGSVGNTSSFVSNFSLTIGSVQAGQLITGTAIPTGTTVLAVLDGGATLLMSQAATGTHTAEAITLSQPVSGFTMSVAATGTAAQETLTFSLTNLVILSFAMTDFVVLANALTKNYASGTLVANSLRPANLQYNGNAVLMWLNQLIVATVGSRTGTTKQGIAYSIVGNPFIYNPNVDFHAGVANGKGERVFDLQAFGQFFLANSRDVMQIGQQIFNNTASSYGVFLSPYLSGDGMGTDAPGGCISYNNLYYYPSTSNGIISVSPAFTGTSSSAALTVLSDKIHNLYRQFTFLRVAAFNRKILWRVSVAATPETPITYYYLVYDLVRQAFTLLQHPSIDLVVFTEKLCLFGTDGNIYEGEYDSYEDFIGGKAVGYLAEAYSKRYDFGEPSLPKESQYCMVQGRILTGTTLFVDVLYNEGGVLGKTTYSIVGDAASRYFATPDVNALGLSDFGVDVMGAGNAATGFFRVYIELNKNFKAHNYQLRFYTEKAGSFWSIALVSPQVELSTIPNELVISPGT